MTKYLQMNGTSSDQIILPSISIDKIVYEYYFDSTKTTSTSWYMDDNVSKGHVGQSGATCTKQDGTVVSIGYNYANVVKDVKATFSDSYTITKMFGLIAGNLYDVKIYKAGVLVAHYDMSTGTVADQSGNGNNATLVGGTWLDDGLGGSTNTPVTYSFDTKQIQYANRTINFNSKQSIYANRLTNFRTEQKQYKSVESLSPIKNIIYKHLNTPHDTRQSIYQNTNQSYSTQQRIYKLIESQFNTAQSIYSNGTLQYTFPLKLIIYKDTETVFDTKQSWYQSVEYSYNTEQNLYKLTDSIFDTKQSIFNGNPTSFPLRTNIYKSVHDEFFTKQSYYKSITSTNDLRQEIYKAQVNDYDLKMILYRDIYSPFDLKVALYKDINNQYDTLQELIADFVEFRKVIEFVLNINTRMNYDLDITQELKFDLKI